MKRSSIISEEESSSSHIQFRSRNGMKAKVLVESLYENESIRVSKEVERESKDREEYPENSFNTANEIFKIYDQENKGFIDEDGIKQMMVDIYSMINKKYEPSIIDIKGFKKQIDCDCDGFISMNDIIKGVTDKIEERDLEKSKSGNSLFRRYDVRDSGKYSFNTNYTFK